MSSKVVTVIPERCRVSFSEESASVILTFEVLIEGEKAGDPAAQQRYSLDPYDAIAIGRRLQDQSLRLLLSLAGYEELPDKALVTDDGPIQ